MLGLLIAFGALQRQVLFFFIPFVATTLYVGSQLTATERLHFNVFDFEHHFEDCELELHAQQQKLEELFFLLFIDTSHSNTHTLAHTLRVCLTGAWLWVGCACATIAL